MEEMKIEDLKKYILGDIEDVIAMLEDTQKRVEKSNNLQSLKEFDDIIHNDIYDKIDLLYYVED